MTLSRCMNLVFSLGLILFFTCAGCVSQSPQVTETDAEMSPAPEEYPGEIYEEGDAAYPEGYYIHTVSLPDESISIIAKWFTGDLLNWEVLAKCNPTINPNRIFLGDKIRIPRSIMTRHPPMTPEFVQESQPQAQRKQKAATAKAKAKPQQTAPSSPAVPATPAPAAAEEESLLFGPKEYSKEE